MTLQVTQEAADRLAAVKQDARAGSIKGLQAKTVLQLKILHDLHIEHPEYVQKDLRMVTKYGEKRVAMYWKLFVKREIRTWGEVMK